MVLIRELFKCDLEHLQIFNHGDKWMEQELIFPDGQLFDVLNMLRLRQIVEIQSKVVQIQFQIRDEAEILA